VNAIEDFCAGLSAQGIAVRDEFIAPSEVLLLAAGASERAARGDFTAARVGDSAKPQRREEIRGDFTCWVREPLFPAERRLLVELEQLRLQLNRENYLGLFELELHYARYPAGAQYARHVDQPFGAVQRKVSLVLYLNAAWEKGTGGALRFFHNDSGFRDIEPIGGRLVCFLTQGREHAVLTAHRERLSLSGWFRSRE
jgi:SM-20-related protein